MSLDIFPMLPFTGYCTLLHFISSKALQSTGLFFLRAEAKIEVSANMEAPICYLRSVRRFTA